MAAKYNGAKYVGDIYERLLGYYTADDVGKWLETPHPQLNMKSPEEVIISGLEGYKKVSAILDRLDGGNYI